LASAVDEIDLTLFSIFFWRKAENWIPAFAGTTMVG
jgi:hypothetical protein